MAAKVFIDGTVYDPEAATIPVTDRGFLYGDSVYEVMRTAGGKPDLNAPVPRLLNGKPGEPQPQSAAPRRRDRVRQPQWQEVRVPGKDCAPAERADKRHRHEKHVRHVYQCEQHGGARLRRRVDRERLGKREGNRGVIRDGVALRVVDLSRALLDLEVADRDRR